MLLCVTTRRSLFLVSVITHRHLCPRHCAPLTVSHSRPFPCLVRVLYIRTRTSPSHSRAPRSLSRLSLSSVALSRLMARLSLDVPLVSSLVSLVLRLGPRPPFSRFTSPFSRLASIAGQFAFTFTVNLSTLHTRGANKSVQCRQVCNVQRCIQNIKWT